MSKNNSTKNVKVEAPAKLEGLQSLAIVKEMPDAPLPQLEEIRAELSKAVAAKAVAAEETAAELEVLTQRRKEAYIVRAVLNRAWGEALKDETHPVHQLVQAHKEAVHNLTSTVVIEGGIHIGKAPQGGAALSKADSLRKEIDMLKTVMGDVIATHRGFASFAEAEGIINAEDALFKSKKEDNNA